LSYGKQTGLGQQGSGLRVASDVALPEQSGSAVGHLLAATHFVESIEQLATAKSWLLLATGLDRGAS